MSALLQTARAWLSHDAPPLVQFVKYAAVGAAATVLHLAVAGACAAWVVPCLGPDDVLVKYAGLSPADIAEGVRATRAVACNWIGFAVANVFCWLLSRAIVFRPGRHRWPLELALFFAGSALAPLAGSALIWALIRLGGAQTSWSLAANVAVAALVNYALRKFVVFKG